MKRILLFLFLLISLASYSQYTLIPDLEFENYLIYQGYDSNVDGKVLTSNIISVTDIHIFPGAANINIKDLTGIEDFKALKKLDITNCNVINLDLSKNLLLTELICPDNNLVSLNVTGCINLETINCHGNQLTNLDFNNNINLKTLYCSHNNISNLNLNENIQLLDCSFNQLTNLNLNKCSLLHILSCGKNLFTNIDVSKNGNLSEFWCQDNQLTSLDVTANFELTNFGFSNNQLSNIDITNNSKLLTLTCTENKLENLDLSHNIKLTDLYCGYNKLEKLDFSNNSEIIYIVSYYNNLTSIDITKNNKLYSLICNNNSLNNLDTSKNTALNFLNCEFNQITSLDVSKNNNLGLLRCNNNQLTLLDLRSSTSWTWWSDYNNWSNNPDLRCINVPDAYFFGYYWDGRKDVTANYIDDIPPKFESTTQVICSKQNPKLSDVIVKGYNIKWFDSEVGGNELPITTPLIEDKTYFAMNTSGSCEGPKSSVTISFKNTSAPNVTSPQSLCNIKNPTVINLNVSGNELLWYNAINGGDAISNSTPLINGHTYYVSQSNNGCESPRTSILVNIQNTDLPVANSPQIFCFQQNATLDNITITGQNIKWYNAQTAGTFLPNTTILQKNGVYYASQTINGCESERTAVTVNIQNTLAPTGDANQPFCTGQNPTITNIQVTGNLIKWYDALNNGSLLTETTNLIDGKTYYASQTVNNCESERFGVKVSIVNTPSAPAGNANQSFCKKDNAALSNIIIQGQNIKWYDTNLTAAALTNTTLLENNKTYYASQTVGCESDKTAVSIQIYNTPLPTGSNNQQFCIDENATIANLNITGTALKWYDSGANGNILTQTTLLQNGVYYATQTLNNCESERLAVKVKIQDTQAPIIDSPQTFCIQKNAKISNIDIAGQNIQWFESTSSSVPLSQSTLLKNGVTYYASQIINNCESDKIPVKITILEATIGDCINYVEELPFPKFFTPNNDGYNDTWTIDFAYLKPNTGIRIFDRYGKFIKELTVNNTAWDGTYIGQDEPASDYWFTVKRINGAEFRGHFSLKR